MGWEGGGARLTVRQLWEGVGAWWQREVRRSGGSAEMVTQWRPWQLTIKNNNAGHPLVGPYRLGQIITFASLHLLPFSRLRRMGWI